MYRRRRPQRGQITFGFDCFLDLVTNLIGIIVRLILVAWVGARSYSATMNWSEDGPPSTEPAPRVVDDPLHAELERTRRALDEARARLLAQLDDLDGSRRRSAAAEAELASLSGRRYQLTAEAGSAGVQRAQRAGAVHQTALSLAELRQRSGALVQEIKALESQPAQTKVFRYHAPVSRAVYDDQLRFECRHGRVTFIDMTGMVAEMKSGLDERLRVLRTQWSVSDVTGPAGPFRLRYTFFREKTSLEASARGPLDSVSVQLGYHLVLEPLSEFRGETLAAALAPGSEFRTLVDRLDPRLTVVTFHVYADSFPLFRQLRDYLYERDIEVAAAPQPGSDPIAFSPQGAISRGQ
jgi:hypothetical protein